MKPKKEKQKQQKEKEKERDLWNFKTETDLVQDEGKSSLQ